MVNTGSAYRYRNRILYIFVDENLFKMTKNFVHSLVAISFGIFRQVSHEFFLNLDPNNPYCPGVEGVLAAYQR
jgi:hypothetical protein